MSVLPREDAGMLLWRRSARDEWLVLRVNAPARDLAKLELGTNERVVSNRMAAAAPALVEAAKALMAATQPGTDWEWVAAISLRAAIAKAEGPPQRCGS